MASHRKQPDSQDDAWLEQVLRSDYAAPEPAAEFQEGLLRKLNKQFADTYLNTPDQAKSQTNGHPSLLSSVPSPLSSVPSPLSSVPSLNDATTEFQPSQTAPKKQTTAISSTPKSSTPKRRIGLRLAMTMAVAASLLLAVSLWNSHSAYGWAAMLRALENCEWVQADSVTAKLRGWVSSQRGVVAIRSANQVAFHDHGQQKTSAYFSDRQVVAEQQLSTNTGARGAAALFGLIFQDKTPSEVSSKTLDSSALNIEVVTESWRHRKETVELRVTLKVSGAQEKLVRLVFLIDPETHLPINCRLLSGSQADVKSLDFTYPSEGPESIFSLGIPRDTEVLAQRVLLADARSRGPRESQDSRFLGSSPAEQKSSPQKTTSLSETPPSSNQSPATKAKKDDLAVELAKRNITPKVFDVPSNQTVPTGRSERIVAEEIVSTEPLATGPLATEATGKENSQHGESRVALNSANSKPTITLSLALPSKALSSQELVKQVNELMGANWQARGITVAQPASDTEFLRRVYLDLTGRIPRVDEVYRFLEDDEQGRRERLVDALLASRDHATHLATVWRSMLLPEGVDATTYDREGTKNFDQWLADRFEKNLPYDQLVSQLLLAEGRISDSGPILFYATLKLNPEELAGKTARAFLGTRMECAQCHDHFFDDSITQEDFWGFAAHFAQISRPRGEIEITPTVLRVRDIRRGEVLIPDTDEIVSPKFPYAIQQENGADKQTDQPPGAEGPSRRQMLVDWLTSKQNNRFARATVNRVWQHLFGLGLVEPVDDMRADNPAVYPDVLEALSLNFAASNYDLRSLLRTLVLSDAYQLSSRSKADEPSQGLSFARMNIKSFTAAQLYDCISVATESEAMQNNNPRDGSLARFSNTSRRAFIEQFQAPAGQRTDYHAGIPQALTLMHGYLIHGATDLTSSGLLKSLNAPFFTNEQRIETLFISSLSRYPEEVERTKMLEYLETVENDAQRSQALGDILWALLNSAEFTFIH